MEKQDKTLAVVFGGISVLLLLTAVVAVARLAGAETQPAALAPEPLPSQEQVFILPRPVLWTGNVISVVNGGSGYAVQLESPFGGHDSFLAMWPDDRLESLSEKITIRGRWLGITCAYRYTLFNNKCVPEVEIDEVEPDVQ